MKAILLILACLILQTDIDAQQLVVSARKMNVCYLDLPNVLDVAVSNLPCSDLKVTINKGNIKKVDSCTYEILPERPGNVYVMVSNSSNTIIDSVEFRVKSIPEPKAQIIISRGLDHKPLKPIHFIGLTAELENFDFDLRYHVKSYTMRLIRDADTLSTTACEGSRVCNEFRQYENEMMAGDRVVFDDIVVENNYGRVYNLDAIEYLIE